MKTISPSKSVQHLYSRAAFGISIAELRQRSGQELSVLVDELFAESATSQPIQIVDADKLDTMNRPDIKTMSVEEKKKLRQERTQSMFDLNQAWMQKLYTDKARLRERLTFFWHGHFACRLDNPLAMQDLNNIHRKHALGNFRDMLMAVSKSPAMLQFLNNQQNRKMHPNENFAREVMELFTIGRGNYTENDIKEGARAFTGWGFERETGAFVFREKAHDEGVKTFLGRTGNFRGEDIIDILLSQKGTALYICRKIYRFLVNDTPDEKQVHELAESFYASNYDIALLVRKIFTADWFYAPENMGVKIKSPVELLAGINRLVPVTYESKNGLLLFQRALGQALFYPPNVSGWAGGKSWIDSSSLMFRLKIASLILNDGHVDVQPKDDLLDDKQNRMKASSNARVGEEASKKKNAFHAIPDWQEVLASIPADSNEEDLINWILLPQASAALRKNLKSLHADNRRAVILELLSSPEYQMA
jgi:uncharacterized protein (DUF1800 family)